MESFMTCTFELEASWQNALSDELEKPYMAELQKFIDREQKEHIIYPPKDLIFNAFAHTPYDNTRVVIVGQDPYHGPSQAHGLSFSVQRDVKLPPSLQNIFKEIKRDVGDFKAPHGCLLSWADQGVLLLNSILTVRKGLPASHQGKGWENFTDAALMKLNERDEPLVFILWGMYAQQKGRFLDGRKHLILKSPHPSPFSARKGFFGCGHFSGANAFLKKNGQTPIDWRRLD